MNLLTNLDAQITNFIYFLIPHNLVMDSFFSFFSLKGNSIFIWILIIILILIFEERKNPGISKKDISFLSTFLVVFVLASFASQILIKNVVKRQRPCYSKAPNSTEAVEFGLQQCLKDYSFPSSHATAAFAAATVISAFDKKRRWFYFLTAIIISLSRIYLGYHYFLDVMTGALLGWLTSYSFLFLPIKKFKLQIFNTTNTIE